MNATKHIEMRGVTKAFRFFTLQDISLDLETEGVIVTRHGKGSFVAEAQALAGELQEDKLHEHLNAAAQIAHQLGLTDEELATRLRRVQKKLEQK